MRIYVDFLKLNLITWRRREVRHLSVDKFDAPETFESLYKYESYDSKINANVFFNQEISIWINRTSIPSTWNLEPKSELYNTVLNV